MTTLLRKVLVVVVALCTQFAMAQTHQDGFTAMQLENWDKAISVYTALVKAKPTDQVAMLTLGNAQLAKGDKAAALATFKSAFDANPDGAYALIANGRVLLLQDNATEADNQFKKAAKVGKKDVTALRLIGESYIFYMSPGSKRPNLTRAEELLKQAMAFNNKDVNTLMMLGYTYKEMPNGGLSALHYEYAEAVDGKNPLIKLMLAKVYKAAKLPEKAVELFDKAISVSPKYSLALRGKAEHLYFARKWEAATQAYKDLIANGDEVIIEDEMQLANCLFITKDYKGCSELVEKIIAKDGSKTYLRRLNGYCLYETGDYAKAAEVLNTYFKVAPADKILGSDYQYLGRTQIKSKADTLVAIENLRKAMVLDTSLWAINKEIGDLYRTKRMNCEASKVYAVYLDSVPKQDLVDMYNYGVTQYFCKDDSLRYVNAEATFKKITELRPTAAIGWLWAGKAAAKQDPDIEADSTKINEFGKAKAYFEKYVELAGADPAKNKKDLIDSYGYLAYIPYVKNDLAGAKVWVEKILAIDPTNTTYTEMLNAINGVAPTTPPGGRGK